MTREMFVAAMGLSFFIICPRMAGMVHIIAKNAQLPLIYTALYGSVIAIPMILVMVMVFGKLGVWGALAFCVMTDLLSALFMKSVSTRASIETLVIAVFVILGVKAAPYITGFFIK
ncbi:hypothetical protein [Desulfonema magnum]|uniref:Uncharacterized protein n=1 Tax=Desulfonema magnum TaxID=45655 RepID=A0A975BL00_9BACT|nr:hypothetical protein [Desulfonema magnum]QTA87009.1 Uncharacterized protein dnm_030360 [Desulfonema magnum]